MNLPLGTPEFKTEEKKCDDKLAVELKILRGTWDEYFRDPAVPLLAAFLPPVAIYLVIAPIVWFAYKGFRSPKTR